MKLSFLRTLSVGLTALMLLCCWKSSASVLIKEIMYYPSSEDIREEYIELYNAGQANVNLSGRQFSKRVQFTFPNVTLIPHVYLLFTANVDTFTKKYPGLSNVGGGWTAQADKKREEVDLDDAEGNRADSVDYADEGDWAAHRRGPYNRDRRGWIRFAELAGNGKSLELINTRFFNKYDLNWVSGLITDGTARVRGSNWPTLRPAQKSRQIEIVDPADSTGSRRFFRLTAQA